MRVAIIKHSFSQQEANEDSWLICYKKVYPKDHAVIKATEQVDSCLKKTKY